MANEQPQKSDNASSGGGGGKSNNRRYFRRRRKGSGTGAGSGGEGQAAPAPEKEQARTQSDSKPQQGNRGPEPQRNEQQEKRRKRRRSGGGNSSGGGSGGGNNNSRRSGSGRRGRRDEQGTVQTAAPEPERYREPMDVYVHTHIVRPAYRDAGNDYVSEKSFLAERRPPESSIHMDRLEEDIRKQLDEYLNRPVVPVKVIFEMGDEGWDDETEE
jgi:hypothetical protein